MDSLGLGLVLSFVDNASAGMNSASSSLREMTMLADSTGRSFENSATSFALVGQGATMLGNSLVSAGSKITGVISGMINNVSQFGSKLETTRVMMTQFWGSAQEGEKMLDWIYKFGASTPFMTDDLKDIAIAFKTANVDISESIEMTNGKTQEFAAFLGDLMTLKPDADWALAFKNALAGMPRMLDFALPGKLKNILGHELGKTGEEVKNSLVELAQKLNVEGLMHSMMGTWQQTMANMQNVWSKFMKNVVDAGSFERLKLAFINIADSITYMDEEKLQRVATIVSEGLGIIINPLIKLSELAAKFIKGFTDFAVAHPIIGKLAIGIIGISGAMLVALGTMLKFSGGLFYLMSITKMMGESKGLTNLFSQLGSGFIRLTLTILPLIAVLGILYFAWKNDLGGLKTSILSFVDSVNNSFKKASEVFKYTYGSKFIRTIDELKKKSNEGDWFSALTISIIKVGTFFQGLAQAWNTNKIDKDTFEKANELGLIPLITNILILRDNLSELWAGFKIGVGEFIEGIKNALGSLEEIGINVDPLFDFVNKLVESSKKLSKDEWKEIGRQIGFIGSGILFAVGVLVPLCKGLSFIVGLFSGFVSVLGLPITIALIVIGVLVLMYTKFEWFRDIVQAVFWSIVATVAITVGMVAVIVAGLVVGIAQLFTYAVATVISVIMGLVGAFKIAGVFITGIIKAAISLGLTIIQVGCAFFCAIVQSVIAVFLGIIKTGMAIFKGIIDTVIAIVVAILTGNFTDLGAKLNQIWSGVGARIGEIWDNVWQFIKSVWESVLNILQEGWQALQNIWQDVMGKINTIADDTVSNIKGVWSGITNFFSGIWEGIENTATPFFEWINKKFELVTGLINKVNDFFSGSNNKELTVNVIGNEQDKKAVGLATGGYVKTSGMAMLHPNEVVVNDSLTKGLTGFISDYNSNRLNNVVPMFAPAENTKNSVTPRPVFNKNVRIDSPYNTIRQTNRGGDTNNDYSVTFGTNSIVVNVANASEAEAERIAELIMKKIERKQQREQMRNYKGRNKVVIGLG